MMKQIAYSVMGEGRTLFLVGAPVGITGFSGLAASLSHRFRIAFALSAMTRVGSAGAVCFRVKR